MHDYWMIQCGPIDDGSPLSASDVSNVRRPGCTPRFSQLIHERRAVRSTTSGPKKTHQRFESPDLPLHRIYYHWYSNWPCPIWSRRAGISPRRSADRSQLPELRAATQCTQSPAAACRFCWDVFRTETLGHGRAAHRMRNWCFCGGSWILFDAIISVANRCGCAVLYNYPFGAERITRLRSRTLDDVWRWVLYGAQPA